MTRKKKPVKQTRKRYPEDYKTEVLGLADRIGVGAAAKQLGLHESQIYGWRSKARVNQEKSGVEQGLAAENVRLKRQLAEREEELAILKKAAAYFAKSLK